MKSVKITLTTAGAGTGPFNIYSNVDQFITPFETNIAKSSLEAGYISTSVPDAATTLRVESAGATCTGFYTDLTITGGTPSSANIYITNAAGEVGKYDIDEYSSSRITYTLHVENAPFIGYVNIRASRGFDTRSATVAFRIENDIYGPLSLEVNSDMETSTLVNIPVGTYYCYGEAYGTRAQGGRETIVDGNISYGYTQVFAEGLPNTSANVRYEG